MVAEGNSQWEDGVPASQERPRRKRVNPAPFVITKTPPTRLTATNALGSLEVIPKVKEAPVAVKSIQLGQVWRKDDDGQDYLVTKVYSEVFSQYAVLRPAEVTAPDAPTVRVKVAKGAQGASLPGFTFTQEGSF
jgi:hypothetical protein